MTIRNLDRMFAPASVAIIGASERAQGVGGQITRNALSGGFKGPVYLINQKRESVFGHACYRSVEALPAAPDLAVIATPSETVPDLIGALGRKGTKAAVVVTAGFDEAGTDAGRARKQAMLDQARPHLLRILGPNCVGLLLPNLGLNVSFAPGHALPGNVAFVGQSGAVLTSVLDWARDRGLGFSQFVSMGNMADVDFGDVLDYLAQDPTTKSILLYIEAITASRKFMSAARAAARSKPVVVLKSGRHAAAASAAASHTGAMAGRDVVYDAAFRRAGFVRVFDIAGLFDAAGILALARPPLGDALTILTNGGGIGVIATDTLIDLGGQLATLSPATRAKLDAVLPSTWSKANPIDIIGDAPGERYRAALDALADDPALPSILVMYAPTALASSTDAAEAVLKSKVVERKLLLTSWLGGSETAKAARDLFAAARVPTFDTPDQAVRAHSYLTTYRRAQTALMQTPPSLPELFAPDRQAVRDIIAGALRQKRAWLNEPEAKAVLSAYRIPVARTETAKTPGEAVATAISIGFPVALKILSRDILHKSDVGGVALDLNDAASVQRAAETMLARVAEMQPDAHIDGFTVQTMIRRPGAYELILGLTDDRTFGPVVLFGQGGVSAEIVGDRAVALPPLNLTLAHELMGRTRIHRLLQGFRDRKAAALDEVALTLVKLSQLAADLPEIAELDINPLLADDKGVIALDARIRVRPRQHRDPTHRFAIRPYPSELEETVVTADGMKLTLRPILPEDEPKLVEAFERLSPNDIRLRFMAPIKTMTHEMAARLTQIDYDRQMALVLADPGPPGKSGLHGICRISADPDFTRAEFAVIVRSEEKARGRGWLMMNKIIDYARARGLKEIFGYVLADNQPMLKLSRDLGFTVAQAPDDGSLRIVTLRL
ncbi:MAG: GNAT family N-acetyltransferase [Alphaproteobacteria bacterium]